MNTKDFNFHVEEILSQETTLLEQLSLAAYCLQDNTEIAKIGCKALIRLCNEIGWQYNLDLKSLANETLVNKAKEYAIAGDRLANFKSRYAWQEQYSRGRLLGYLEKHLTSCADILSEQLKPTKELILEKFGDTMNYSILLYALLNEE